MRASNASTVVVVRRRMTQRRNPRRNTCRRQDHGPTWESATPNAGANSTHVARSRRRWKRIRARKDRRAVALDLDPRGEAAE
jgi:hypothetical protein